MTFHFYKSAVNLLTSLAKDPVAKMLELKVSAVGLEKARKGERWPVYNWPVTGVQYTQPQRSGKEFLQGR